MNLYLHQYTIYKTKSSGKTVNVQSCFSHTTDLLAKNHNPKKHAHIKLIIKRVSCYVYVIQTLAFHVNMFNILNTFLNMQINMYHNRQTNNGLHI